MNIQFDTMKQSIDKRCISGVVIVYYSERKIINNINSYLSQIDHLYIIDNSNEIDPYLYNKFNQLSNATYIHNKSNMGIAYALNKAAILAIKSGYKYLLTMDDDTSVPGNTIQTLLSYINQLGSEKIGIITGQSDPKRFTNSVKFVPFTITSGSLLNLSAYQKCGPFMDELFIDFVDHEYCFRLAKVGYRIIELNNLHFNHRLGLRKCTKNILFNHGFYWISHNPVRIYYKTRNCLYVLNKYNYLPFKIKSIFYKDILSDFIKIFFLEDAKCFRFNLFIKALLDAFRGKLGKIDYDLNS